LGARRRTIGMMLAIEIGVIVAAGLPIA